MILLVHGWGYDARVWDQVCGELTDLPVVRIDLGFFGDPVGLEHVLSEDASPLLGVGHSLGFLWLLRHAALRCRALLSLGGFARFTADTGYRGVHPAALAQMRRRFSDDPEAALSAFWRDCGAASGVPVQGMDKTALLRGLDWLQTWDERAELAAAPRVSALAGRKDTIVPAEMSAAAFAGRETAWADCGHALPLLEPRLVADAIRRSYRAMA